MLGSNYSTGVEKIKRLDLLFIFNESVAVLYLRKYNRRYQYNKEAAKTISNEFVKGVFAEVESTGLALKGACLSNTIAQLYLGALVILGQKEP